MGRGRAGQQCWAGQDGAGWGRAGQVLLVGEGFGGAGRGRAGQGGAGRGRAKRGGAGRVGAGRGSWAGVGQGGTSPRPDARRLLYPGPQILGDITISGGGGKVMHCSGLLISTWPAAAMGRRRSLRPQSPRSRPVSQMCATRQIPLMLYTAWQLVACCVWGCHSAHASASDALPCPVSLGQQAAGDLRAAPACCAGGKQRRPWPSVEEGAARDRRWQQLAHCGAGRGGAAGRPGGGAARQG